MKISKVLDILERDNDCKLKKKAIKCHHEIVFNVLLTREVFKREVNKCILNSNFIEYERT